MHWVSETCRDPQATREFLCSLLALNEHANDGASQPRPAVLAQAQHVGLGRGLRPDDDGNVARQCRKRTPWPIEHALGLQRGDEFPALGFQFTDGVHRMDGGDLELELSARGVQVHASDDHDLGSFFEIRPRCSTRPHHGVDGSVVVAQREVDVT